jgi:signal transduction histidine kinase
MIHTGWFVALTIVVVGAIGALVNYDEIERSDAALDDLGERQVELARVVALDPRPAHTQLTDSVVELAPRGGQFAPVDLPELHGLGKMVRLSPERAALFGLPARTAMVGLAGTADGGTLAVVTSAAHQRDRDRTGRIRVLLSMVLAASVMTAFSFAIWRRQRHEAQLSRDLAVAETARSRDADLDRLHRAATMAALGSGVAHEIATPLGVIVGRAEQLLTRVAGDDRAVKNVQVILEQSDYIDQVVRGLLGLARGAPIALQAIDADALVREAAALVQHRFARANVTLQQRLAASLPEIRCEPLLFKHALINLLLNACDASPAKSTVHVDVTADHAEIAFVVTDDGEGIPPQHAARATEPFFTTKTTGTGLGLAIANEIAKTHRGTLDLSQRTPHGTRACIRIPIEPSEVMT